MRHPRDFFKEFDLMSPISWQRNLYIMVVVEFMVLLAFGFTNPFIPFFIQDLGKYTDSQAAFWSGIATSVFGLTMFLSGPIWGIIADRWGRKPMVLRAIFGVAALSVATALAPNVYWIIIFRALQGLFSGTVAAASAMVSASTPKEKIPFAMGLLAMSVYAGNTPGPLAGSLIAYVVGYRGCFYVIAGVYLLGGLAVLGWTREKFVPVVKDWGEVLGSLGRMAISREVLPLLMVLFILAVGPSVITPVLPLIIKVIGHGSESNIASGLAFSLMGVVATVSSLAASRLAGGKTSLKKIMIWSCLGTGILYLPPMFAQTMAPFIILMALRGTFNGGITMSSSSLIALTVSESQQGTAYGLQQSAQFLGFGLGPFIGGWLASVINLRVVFPVAAGLYILSGLLIFKILPELKKQREIL
jgi:DHA1 family multidrug resistance protein-like MFS transporter